MCGAGSRRGIDREMPRIVDFALPNAACACALPARVRLETPLSMAASQLHPAGILQTTSPVFAKLLIPYRRRGDPLENIVRMRYTQRKKR